MTVLIEQKRQPFIVDDRIRKMIAGAVAEVDPAQIVMLRKMTPAERMAQASSMINAAEQVAAYRLRQKQKQLSESASIVAVRRRGLDFRARVEEQWRNHT